MSSSLLESSLLLILPFPLSLGGAASMITGERTGGELMDSDKGVASEVGEGSTLVTEETEL